MNPTTVIALVLTVVGAFHLFRQGAHTGTRSTVTGLSFVCAAGALALTVGGEG